uniref:ADF-H domain-containing protein n=1 Tax=Compsopogon caeruleus TaxID=31354 RepID=A0A6T6CIG9_9RHOD|mmetsp:Transcript_6299/g.12549  ORF Transcript_6299/g.12549 Transcript_6299/m.12549 type:complete len:149 (+) Transcript_6299:2132-2578(+)|eukprot:CAMPEP_0184678540 /NCGR_PEP_ID=MMETSP0312-20130426/1290_1 /TAXON_ID=31354 /ORGANISM="Compsopogon coeruleus, Strain SAG 36.94" /LENGTH=148 /DNA_ID=CAMNT_0027127355 /DNA_START=3078 /DNA_END=3524 /DNA_ORIENTATION=-
MASGVAVDPKCVEEFQALVRSRKYRGLVMKINDEMTSIGVERTLSPIQQGDKVDAKWTEFTKTLPENDCRYIVYDFEYEMQGIKKNRVIFMLWSPEYSKVKSKMIYASSQEGCVNAMEGIQRQLQSCDMDEMAYEYIANQLKQFTASY